MKKYIYILVTMLFLSCDKDNIGPLFEGDIIFFDQTSFEVDENQSGNIVVNVKATSVGAATSKISLGGNAVEGVDYLIVGDLNLEFPDGVYADEVTISLIDNTDENEDKALVLSLPEGQGYSNNNRREITITINDDDVPGGTVTVAVSESADDVEEGETGAMSLDSSDLELGEFDTSGTPDQGVQTIGLRFNGINIPANAVITEATIQFTADNIGADPVELTIYGENVGNAAPYNTNDFNVTSRTKTGAKAVWAIPEWVTAGDQLSAQKTVDLSSLVQEVVNRSDWNVNNSINFIMEHTGVSANVTSSSGGREAETIDGTAAPVLTISWE